MSFLAFPRSSEFVLPNPLTRRRVCPSPFGSGGGDTEREGPNSDEGTDGTDTAGTLGIFSMYFVW
jgi:hypothetical protein